MKIHGKLQLDFVSTTGFGEECLKDVDLYSVSLIKHEIVTDNKEGRSLHGHSDDT